MSLSKDEWDRETRLDEAEHRIKTLIFELREKVGITHLEELRILNSIAADSLKYAIRRERKQ